VKASEFGLGVVEEGVKLGARSLRRVPLGSRDADLQVYARTFGMQEPEELQEQQRFALDQAAGPVRLPLDRPLWSTVHGEGLARRVEIVLAFVGAGGLTAPTGSCGVAGILNVSRPLPPRCRVGKGIQRPGAGDW
jgi:hypothetical protein